MPPANVSFLDAAPDCRLSSSVSAAVSPSDTPCVPMHRALKVEVLLYEILKLLPNPAHIAITKGVARIWRRSGQRALMFYFHINLLLSPYFTDVLAFRRLQCELDILISGSFALAMFRKFDDHGRRTLGPTSDMDLFIEWTLADELEQFLTSDGYRIISRFVNPPPIPAPAPPGLSVPDDSFERVVRYARGDRHIDVVCTTATPVYCIFRFHSTVVMNFVTWNRAYSMFPVDTLLKNRGLVLRLNNDRTRQAIDKYTERGFDMIQWREAPTAAITDSLRPCYRWVGDNKCWAIDLDTSRVIVDVDPSTGITDSMAIESDYPYSINGFSLDYDLAQGPTSKPGDLLWYPRQDCDLLTHQNLLYSYAAASKFRKQVKKYLRSCANRGTSRGVDNCLECVKDEFARCAEP